MAFSPQVIAELRRELEGLIVQHRLIAQKIELLRQLIGSDAVTLTPPPSTAGLHVRTWKDVVRHTLRDNPGAKAAKITKILRERGEAPGGETRLSHRVYNEVWRMVQAGEARRTAQGGFVLNEERGG
jgi:hypothetical protein